jgi:hypothetical protein
MKLTDKQKDVLTYISGYMVNGGSPPVLMRYAPVSGSAPTTL